MKIKFNLTYLLFLFTITLSVLACSKDSDSNDINNNSDKNIITAKVNGKDYKSNPLLTAGAALSLDNVLTFTIQGVDDNDAKIHITGRINSTSKGTYKIQSDEANDYVIFGSYILNGQTDPANVKYFFSSSNEKEVYGEITFTEITTSRLKGTFYFNANEIDNEANEVKITNGAFNISF